MVCYGFHFRSKFSYNVSCYMLELYNDKLLDLFNKDNEVLYFELFNILFNRFTYEQNYSTDLLMYIKNAYEKLVKSICHIYVIYFFYNDK